MSKPSRREILLILGLVGMAAALVNHPIMRVPQPGKAAAVTELTFKPQPDDAGAQGS